MIFLAEAFTRPKVMKRLAKLGFSQSYSYFTWRNEKWEIEEYLRERPLNLTATTDARGAYEGADYVVVATPTDYDTRTNYFDTTSVESVVADVERFSTTLPSFLEPGLETLLLQNDVEINAETLEETRSPLLTLLLSFGPALLMIGLFVFALLF